MTPETVERTPMMVHCRDCRHEWAALYLPLRMDKRGTRLLSSVGRAPCPMCASPKVYVGLAPKDATP